MPLANPEKRRAIMARSMKLGHCICSPDRPCPCDIYKDQGLCPCAGDRPEPISLDELKLTALVHNAGCASKIAPADLEGVLSRLPEVTDPAVISGLPAGDDAGVYRLSEETALVQTVDVFTPCVDDPYTFGRICAANCLSDIYAMGAAPLTALSILAFPSETLHGEVMYQMMKGAMETLGDANCSLLGGHSIKDDEIKLGFAITGLISPERTVSLEAAAVGDVMVLTKPLGVGVLNFARQIGKIEDKGLEQAERSMMALNRDAAEVMMAVGVSACTDVTGFGLFGHLVRIVRKSGVTVRVDGGALPAFDGALSLLEAGVIPGAIERNQEFVGDDLVLEEGVSEAVKHLGFDAQTSGGLLIFVPEERLDALVDGLAARGGSPYIIGKVEGASEGKIRLTAGRERGQKEAALPSAAKKVESARPLAVPEETGPAPSEEPVEGPHDAACCADVFGTPAANEAATSTSPASMGAFGTLMQSVGSPGLLDAKTKELVNFGLVLLAQCDPCLDIHVEKALGMGITREELDEVAWCAIAMGGAPVKMFYTAFWEEADRKRSRI